MRYILFLICTLYILDSRGQNMVSESFSLTEGLPLSHVTDIVEDSLGYLWVGTNGGGLSRFDGSNFTNYQQDHGLPNNVIMNLLLSSKNQLWISTVQGISRFSDGKFKVIPIRNGPVTYYSMFEHLDTLYFFRPAVNKAKSQFGRLLVDSIESVDLGWSSMDYSTITEVIPINYETVALFSNEGYLLLKKKHSSTILTIPREPIESYVITEQGIYINARNIQYKVELSSNSISDYNKDELVQQLSGNFNGRVNNPDSYWSKQLLTILKSSFDRPSRIFKDREGLIWIGTLNDGLIKVSNKEFKRLNDFKVKVKTVLIDSRGKVWAGSDGGGLFIYTNNIQSRKIEFNNKDRNYINSLQEDQEGNIWAATRGGLARISPDLQLIEWISKKELENGSILKIAIDANDTKWLMSEEFGIASLMNDSLKFYSKSEGLVAPIGWDMQYFERSNRLFVCTEFGINYFENDRFVNMDIPDIAGKLLLSIKEFDKDRILIGTGGGGLYLSNIHPPYEVLNIGETEGLSSNFVVSLSKDSNGAIWIGNTGGIDVVRINSESQLKEVKHIGKSSGVFGVNINALDIKDAQVIFGTTDGVYSGTYPTQAQHIEYPLHVVSASTFGKEIEQAKKHKITLEYTENNVTFTFNKVSKRNPDNIRFRYKLQNWDKDWSIPSDAKSVTYKNLTPGDYIFRLISTDNRGNSNFEEVKFFIYVKPSFFQRWYIKMAVFLIIFIIFFAFFYLRYRHKLEIRLKAEQFRASEGLRIRKEIGQEFHDEMGNQLARIINYVGLLKLNTPNTAEVLEKAEQSAKYLLAGTRDFLWAIDPLNDNIDHLGVHIRDFGEKLLSERGIEFRVFNSIIERIELPFGYTRQINLIFKEALTNTFKHSQAGSVVLKFEKAKSVITITLEDNGIGIPDKSTFQGEGLENMRMRALRIEGNLTFVRKMPRGTVVKLSFVYKS